VLLRGWVGRSRASRAGPWMARHGVPPQQCRSEGTVEPERDGRMAGQGPFAYFWGCLPKVSRRKGGTRRRPSHIKRICTPWFQQEQSVHIRYQRLTERWVSLLQRVPFVKQPQKEPKRPCPSVRPSLRSGSLAPVPLRGHAVTGHPWPNTALPASMPGGPLRRTSSRPPEGASRSRSKADQKRPCRRCFTFCF